MKEAKSEQSANQVLTKKKKKDRKPISKLSIIAIALTACLATYGYYHDQKQSKQQQKSIAALQAEIANLKQTTKQTVVDELQSSITDSINQQNQQFSTLKQNIDKQLATQQSNQEQLTNQINDSIKVNQQSLAHLNERLSALSTVDSNLWLISQANYLVNLAGRKIWNDQDYTTARLLLKSADESLAQTNDPSLLPARQAINRDITSLKQISFVDTDGIVMNLLNLADSVGNLPLIGGDQSHKSNQIQFLNGGVNRNQAADKDSANQASANEATQNSDNRSIDNSSIDNSTLDKDHSDNSSSWLENLRNSASSFMQRFIYIEKVDQQDGYTECLAKADQDEKRIIKCQILKTPITLEQSIYLRENIRFHLLIAAQAVPRHQEEIYQRELREVATWVDLYFDNRSPNVKTFMTDLNSIKNQSIRNKNIPENLSSSDELEKLMQNRVRSLMIK
ncbi:uroporphyrinogen-III C-methyltransferase [Orbaceae bacterium ESL0721]|nr:uroporphyrinogen-III C-methyltransferase [Orbaceae bacterium ESL0721]